MSATTSADPASPEPVEISNAKLAEQDPTGRLYNEDLAPAQPSNRQWNTYSLFSLWMNDAHNVGNYTFAAGLFIAGLSPFDVTLGVFIGAIIIFVGCCMSGFMGHATGTPYPVISRMSWGIWGANIPAVVRGVVAIAWYGIQTYLASISLKLLMLHFIPSLETLEQTRILGLGAVGWMAFLILSALQLAIVWRGMEAVRHFQGLAGPIIWVVMLSLAIWLLSQADWHISWFTGGGGNTYTGGERIYQTAVAVGLTVGTLATLMLNFSDFARYSSRRKSIILGNVIGLPLNWTAFVITSVVMSASAARVYGEANLDPGVLLERIGNDTIFLIGSVAFVFATIGVNIVANFVSASFDISNINPKRISFQKGGIITAVVSVVVMPWHLYSSPTVIAYFLGALGALLGPFFGILVVDYFLIRKEVTSIPDLYLPNSKSIYFYNKGFNGLAVKAFVPSAAVSLSVALIPWFSVIAAFGWFIGAPLAGVIYYFIAKGKIKSLPDPE